VRRPLSALVAAGALLPLTAPDAHACAGCRNPSMPVARLEAVELAPGEVRATALLGATYLDTLHAAGCADLANCDEVPAQPTYMHHQKIYPAELRAIAEVGLTATLGIELQFPFRVVGTTIQYTTPEGQPYVPADPGVHHRDETLAGIADPWLLGRWGARLGDFLLVLRAGVSLPLGGTQPNPFLLGDVGIRHQHIQFGTGTFDPVAGFQVARPIGSVQLAAYAQGQASLYQNTHGFRAPVRFFGGVQGLHRLFGTLKGGLGVDLLYEGPERWDGVIQQDGNLGRTEVLAAGVLAQTFGETSVTLNLRVPMYRHIVTGDEPGGSLSSPVMLSVIVSRSFGGP
jgi:hypothetical protein